jgi:hypothetical protein
MNNCHQSHKIDQIRRHVQIKVKKAVKRYGNQAAQRPDCKEKSQWIMVGLHSFHVVKALPKEDKKSAH